MSDLSVIAGASGGCFRRGTLVQLEHGKTIPIEELKAGDQVLAFDEDGNLHVDRVVKLHAHTDPQPIFRVKFWRGEVFITPNHWVLNQYSSFVEIQTLGIEDALVDGMGHLRPIIDYEFFGYEPVYNLTVAKYHTFIANDIRVHNGGHRETYPVVAGASGGGKGGGGRAAREDPESLQSKAMVSVLDLLGEGQIGGLLNGAQSIFFNETPLQNPDGSYNFNGVSWDARYGTQDQEYIPGHSDVETPFNVSVQCKKDTPVTFTISNSNVDRVRAIVTLPSLTSTDLTTGDLHGTSVEYKFQRSVDGGPYQDVIADYTWEVATIGANGPLSVTANNPNATQVSCVIRLDATGTSSFLAQNWNATATVQPQKWMTSSSTWLNHGPAITISAAPYSLNSSPQVFIQNLVRPQQTIKDAFYQTDASAIRFVVTDLTTGATLSLVDPKAYAGSPNIIISGKTRSRYQRHHMLDIPKPSTTCNVRMVRITADSTSSALTNDTYLDAYVEIVDAKMTYPNSAVVGVTLDSSLFNKIPKRSYLVKGLYIRYPTNYDPVDRIYSGTWNGTFKVAPSNGNPAWTLFDILTNERYGLGQYIGDSGQYVDKAALYQIGKYCDVMVSDGLGGIEPRFTINTVIQTLAEAYRVITDICSVFQGMAYWAGGMVSFTQDSPKDPSIIYGAANVINGEFNYAGSARRDRHSVIHVVWNDPLDGYKQKIEYIEDSTLVAKYGIRKTEVVGFGCTSRGQANRIGRWMLYSEQYESDIITFGVGLDSALVVPGEVVRINDPMRAGKRMAGRVVSVSATSATLDADINTESSATISFRLPDGSFVDRALIGTSINSNVVTWVDPLVTLPLVNSMFIVSEQILTPVLARILAIRQDESNKNQFVITAHEHNASKYAAIEDGWSLSQPPTSVVKAKPDAPTNLVFTDILYRSGANYASKLHASWDSDHGGELKGWHVRLLGPSDIWQDFGITDVASIEVPNVTDGEDYIIQVRAVNILGIESDITSASRTVLGKSANPSNVTGLVATAGDNGIRLTWNNISDIDLAYYEVREGSDWATATVLGTPANNFFDLGNQSSGLHTWLVRAKDTTDHYSTLDASVTFDVGRPDTPTVTAQFVGNNVEVAWSVVACDNYFVEIVVGGVVKRSFTTTMNSFSYTLEISTTDGGPYRQITVRVRARKNGILSLPGEATSDYNAPPVAPTVILVSGMKAISITVSRCEELDYVGTLIHGSTTPGFTPDTSNIVYEGGTFFMHTDITETWYYKAAHYDAFGKTGLNYSIEYNAQPVTDVAGITTVTELPANPAAVDGQLAVFLDVSDPEIRGIYGWDGSQWIAVKGLTDGAVSYQKLAPDVIGILEDLEIAPGDIKADYIANGAITYDKLDSNLFFDVEIENGEIQAGHIADGAIEYKKLDPALAFEVEVEAGEITTTHIADDAISTPKLKAGAVVASKIAADQITSNHIQSDSIVSLHIKAGQIISTHILADQILANHIKSGEIESDHIAANQIKGLHISSNEIDAGHLKANSITTAKIAAGAITTAKLAIGNFSNLCENNDFEMGLADQSWEKETNWSIVNEPANSYNGSWCAKRDAHTAATIIRNVPFKCVPGQKYIAAAYIKTGTGTVGGGYVRVAMFDISGTFISLGGASGNTVTSNTYARSEVTVTVPEGATIMRLEVVADNTAGTVYVDQVAFTLNSITVIEDGSITTDKIAAEAITSEKIKANNVISSHILAGAVTTDKITATTLHAITVNLGDVTAGTFTLDTQGFIKGGQTDYNTGTGFWMGYNSAVSKYLFSIGSSSGNNLRWDGVNLHIRGNIGIDTDNFISGGQSAYNTGTGFFLGHSGGTYKLSIGNPAGKALLWNGSTLTVQGDIVATGNIQTNAVTQIANVFTYEIVRARYTVNAAWTLIQYLAFNKVTATPSPIFCYMDKIVLGGTTCNIQVRLNGGVIYQKAFSGKTGFNFSITDDAPFVFQYGDTWGVGARVYEIYANTEGAGAGDEFNNAAKIFNRSIIVFEGKR